MQTKKIPLIKQYPVVSFFIMTFLISWGGILLVILGFGGLPATLEQFNSQLPMAIPAMLGGPFIAGILMTYIVNGKKSIRGLFSRLRSWKFHVKWYLFALLAAPLVLIASLLALSLISREYLPGFVVSGNLMQILIPGIFSGIAVGLFEEVGWSGFAVTQLRKRHGIVPTGLLVGAVWGAWHLLSNDVWACRVYAGNVPLALFLIANGLLFIIGQLPAYRILTVWVLDRTGSLTAAILTHVSLTASTMIFQPASIAGTQLLLYGAVSAAAMWLLVFIVYAAKGSKIKVHPQKEIKSKRPIC
jgi:uncharacterized protein